MEIGMTKSTYFTSAHARRVFKQSDEAKNLGFSIGATLIVAAVILIASFDMSTFTFSSSLILAVIFLAEAAILFLIRLRIRAELMGKLKLSPMARLLGILPILFVCTGNVFAFAAGMILVKKKKNLEYQIGIYMLLVDLVTILVSFINIFKGYIMSTFIPAITVLTLIALLHLVITLILSFCVHGNVADKKTLPLSIVLILTAFSGNLLALLLGGIALRKYFNKDPDISVSWIDIIKRLFRSNAAAMGLFLIVTLLTLSTWANYTFDYSMAVDNNYAAILQGPSLMYPLGTDDYGRCVFSRVVFGAKISLITGFATVTVTAFIGITLGAIAGYFSGMTDNVIMRIMDVLLAIPGLLLPIAVISALGTSIPCIIIAIAIGPIPSYARTIRASVITLKDAEFVQASKACGAKSGSIIFKHLLPNGAAPLIVRMTMGFGSNVLSLSSLSYLGVGVQSYIPEWGNILKTGSTYLESASWLAIFPGIMIILLVLSFNFMGDGLRDALDPKLK